MAPQDGSPSWQSWCEDCAGYLRAQIGFELYETEDTLSDYFQTFALVGPAELFGDAEKLMASYAKERGYEVSDEKLSRNELKAERTRDVVPEQRRRKSSVSNRENGSEKLNGPHGNERRTNEVREMVPEQRRREPAVYFGEVGSEELNEQLGSKRKTNDVRETVLEWRRGNPTVYSGENARENITVIEDEEVDWRARDKKRAKDFYKGVPTRRREYSGVRILGGEWSDSG